MYILMCLCDQNNEKGIIDFQGFFLSLYHFMASLGDK